MWFDGIRQPNTQYVLSLSYGKDSTVFIGVKNNERTRIGFHAQ